MRLALVLQSTPWVGLLEGLEQSRRGALLHQTPTPDDPVIIVGHWRSGTTLLHQLLAVDPALAAPTLFHTTWPGCMHTARPVAHPLMGLTVRGTRPMDQVRLAVDEPQEDEWALLKLAGRSPLEAILFPDRRGYFLLHLPEDLPLPEHRPEWLAALDRYLRALTLDTGRRLVLKNPLHGLRIPTLARHLPQARFVHITRDPQRVVPSTEHLWRVLLRDNALRTQATPPSAEEVALGLRWFLDTVGRHLRALEPDRWTELSLEQLQSQPEPTLIRLYQELGMERSPEAREAQQALLGRASQYQPNRYAEDAERERMIAEIFG